MGGLYLVAHQKKACRREQSGAKGWKAGCRRAPWPTLRAHRWQRGVLHLAAGGAAARGEQKHSGKGDATHRRVVRRQVVLVDDKWTGLRDLCTCVRGKPWLGRLAATHPFACTGVLSMRGVYFSRAVLTLCAC